MCNCSARNQKDKKQKHLGWIVPVSIASFVLLIASISRASTLMDSANLLVLATPSPAPTQYSFDALVRLTKNQNYAVQQEAERVFQARKRVRAAITNLLPHIRPRSILAVAFTGPAGLIDAVGDILPFLFPSNWFNARASRRLAEAEDYAYASLRGNELYDVESLYYSYARDRILAQLIDQHLDWYEQVTKRLLAEEQAGTLARGSADYFQVNALKLKEDRSNLTEILWSERLALLHAAALDSADATLDFDTIAAMTLDGATPLDFGPFQTTSVTNSFELKSLDEMINASYYTRKAIWFSYLDPSSDASIGFGMGIPIQISRSQTRGIEVLRASTESLVKQKVIDSVLMFNESIKRYEIAKAESDSTQREMSRLIQRHDAGDSEVDPTKFVDQLSSLEADILTFELNKLSQRYRAMIAKAKLNRLTLQGIYTDLDKPIESEETSGEKLQ